MTVNLNRNTFTKFVKHEKVQVVIMNNNSDYLNLVKVGHNIDILSIITA